MFSHKPIALLYTAALILFTAPQCLTYKSMSCRFGNEVSCNEMRTRILEQTAERIVVMGYGPSEFEALSFARSRVRTEIGASVESEEARCTQEYRVHGRSHGGSGSVHGTSFWTCTVFAQPG